jgi:hypothetical protein
VWSPLQLELTTLSNIYWRVSVSQPRALFDLAIS